jgi:hypothetical protein
MMVRYSGAAALLAGFSALIGTAQAQSLTGNVGSAGITDGEQGVEFRIGLDGDGNAASRFHYDHSFTDWYQLRIIGAFSRPDGADWDYSSLTFENWFQWSEEAADKSGFHGGFRFAYTFADGDGPDEAEVRLTVTDKFADVWEWRANVIGEVETGDGSEGGVGLEARGQLTRAVGRPVFGTASMRIGAELFSEFGNTRDIPGLEDQAHQLGPVVKIDWDNGVYLQSAYRWGLTDGADDRMGKLFIGREF